MAPESARLLPLMPPATARLRIEMDRTLANGLLETQHHFWHDRLSPVILVNAFELCRTDDKGSFL